jgi:hypothetical protein
VKYANIQTDFFAAVNLRRATGNQQLDAEITGRESKKRAWAEAQKSSFG